MKHKFGDYFNLAHIEPQSHIYGPGVRFVIWLQGCALACEGCWNKEMWSFKAKKLIHREHLLQQILSQQDLQGITLLGGEPLHQSNNLLWLLEKVRLESKLTTFVFTGYEEIELQSQDVFTTLFELCDILAIGRYDASQRNTSQQWIGSNNQRLIFPPTSREKVNPQAINQVEIIIEEDGAIRVLGFPDEKLLSIISQ